MRLVMCACGVGLITQGSISYGETHNLLWTIMIFAGCILCANSVGRINNDRDS